MNLHKQQFPLTALTTLAPKHHIFAAIGCGISAKNRHLRRGKDGDEGGKAVEEWLRKFNIIRLFSSIGTYSPISNFSAIKKKWHLESKNLFRIFSKFFELLDWSSDIEILLFIAVGVNDGKKNEEAHCFKAFMLPMTHIISFYK